MVSKRTLPVPLEHIAHLILSVRGQRVILDKDLAGLYGVSTRDLNKAVSRNLRRFPGDFMIQLGKKDLPNLMFHFGTSSWGGTRKPPRVFTEQGVAMLSGLLRSARAIEVNIEIMRTFVRLRRILTSHAQLARKLATLEQKTDTQFRVVFDTIRELMRPPDKPKRRVGF